MNSAQRRLGRLLTAAKRVGRVAKIWREQIDPHPLRGIVLAVADDLMLAHRLSDAIHLDGYFVLRICDITGFKSRPRNASFYERALRLRHERPKLPRGIELTTMGRAIASASDAFPLVTLHREAISPDTCSIGRVRTLTTKTIILRCITPAAKWEGDYPRYRLSDVTLLEFGGQYEDALARVASLRRPARG
jgi:hypothetical protein